MGNGNTMGTLARLCWDNAGNPDCADNIGWLSASYTNNLDSVDIEVW